MKGLFSNKGLLNTFLVILGLLLIGFFIISTKDESKLYENNAIERYKNIYSSIIKKGSDEAYKEFVRTYENEPFGIQHESAHLFGEALYETSGVNGLITCDSSFAFGCYHGFFSVAIASEGPSVISDFDTACENVEGSPSACRHGIGHGIIEYVGPQQLEEGLELCKKTTWSGPIGGCLSGAFMEYNVPLTRDENNQYVVSARPINIENPYAPCTSVKDVYKESCYHELAHWWSLVYEKDYKKIGYLCQDVEDAILRQDCFMGVGNIIAPTTNYSDVETLELCGYMPDEEGERLCRLSAAKAFYWNPKGKEYTEQLCFGLLPLDECIK